MIIAMYIQDTEAGLLYAVGYAALTTIYEIFENIDTLSYVALQNKDGEEALVKGVMSGDSGLHAFLFENGTVRVIKEDKSTFDITLESEIIKMNSGNWLSSYYRIVRL